MKLIDLPYYNNTFPDLPKDLINRDIYIDAIKKLLESHDLIFVEGEEGIGKTILLAQFTKLHAMNTISYFITPSAFSYNPICFKENLFRQIYFYIHNSEPEENLNVDDSTLTTYYSELFRKNKKEKKTLYFVFDNFQRIPTQDLEILSNILMNLPWAKAKFVFSGSPDKLLNIIPPKLKHKTIQLYNFNIAETSDFFSSLTQKNDVIRELYSISQNGNPEKLAQVKRLCIEWGGVENFLNDEKIDEKTNLFELEWKKLDLKNGLNKLILSVLAFDENQIDLEKLAKIIQTDFDRTRTLVEDIVLLELVDGLKVNFKSNSLKKFTKTKLVGYKDLVLNMLLDYFQNNPNDDASIYNLPGIYQKTKRWQDLLQYLTLDAFILFIEKTQSLSGVKRQFDYGLDASKHIKDTQKSNGEYLRFALHKSSLREIEKYKLWESEVEARIVLEDYQEALSLANSAILKEDRLKLLAVLAKQRKLNELGEDRNLNEQIKDLYNQIDFSSIQDKAFEIAGLLIYSCFDLAIDIIEKITFNTAGNNSIDASLAYLSLYASDINKKSKEQVNVDLISSKIQDDDVKDIATAFNFLSTEYDAETIIRHAESFKNTSQRLFLLRYWLINNKKNIQVHFVIEYAINAIISSSDESVPNATALSEIASPLPFIQDKSELNKLVNLLDSQKNTINTPTQDFVKLQLTICEAMNNFDKENSTNRIFEIYLIIDEIPDLSVKTNCLALLWRKLIQIDNDQFIEKSLSNSILLETQILHNINKLLLSTAYHFQMVEFIIRIITPKKPEFIFTIISNLNIQDRRDAAYHLAALRYIQKNDFSEIDFKIFDKFKNKIENVDLKETLIFELVRKYYTSNNTTHVKQLLQYHPDIINYRSLINKCYLIVNLIIVLDREKSHEKNIKRYLTELTTSWSGIDECWEKIEMGFNIARDLAKFSKNAAKEFLNNSVELKNQEILSSTSIVETYLLSTKLCIRAFSGLTRKKRDLDPVIQKLREVINIIPSTGTKIKLWNDIALHLSTNEKEHEFKKVIKEELLPLVNELTTIDKSYREQVLTSIAPTLFLHNQTRFFKTIDDLCNRNKNIAVCNVCDYIFTKLCPDEPCGENEFGYKLSYDEYTCLIELIKHITDDSLFYFVIKKITKSFSNKYVKLPTEQKNDVLFRLSDAISKKLPDLKKGIKHKGYWIACSAEILSVEPFDKKKWDALEKATDNIANLSDRGFVYVMLAETFPKNTSIKENLLQKGFDAIKTIPSNYDKSNRLDSTWGISMTVSKSVFNKNWKEAFTSLLQDQDGNINNIKNLIDVAQQHNSNLAEHAITLLDQDPNRKNIKKPLQKRIEDNKQLKTACKELKNLSTLTPNQLMEGFNKNLSDLNSGLYTCKDIDETKNVLENISRVTLSQAYNSICFFIQNMINKYGDNDKYNELLISVFDATYTNCKLVTTLSSDTIPKMKALHKQKFEIENSSSPIFRNGEREKAIQFIKNWLSKNLNNQLTIIDPYFSENDLEVLKLVKEINSNCRVSILTSKESGLNSGENIESSYKDFWCRISTEEPPETTVQIIWINSTDEKNKKSPFHDRWWITENFESGLKSGTSFNSLGLSKDSQISEMTSDDLQSVEKTVYADYIVNRITRFKDYKLNNKIFDLCSE